MSSCDALLAVIGPTWLTVRDATDRRRLDNPGDYVRHEIATALGRSDLLVIPILVGTTPMPAAAELPEALVPLAECNAVRFTNESWDDQVVRLTSELEKVVKRPVGPPPLHVAASQAGGAAVRMGAGERPIARWLGGRSGPTLHPRP